MYFPVTTIGKLSSQPCQEGRMWQSPRIGLLKCEDNPAKHILIGHVGVICTQIHTLCIDSCSQTKVNFDSSIFSKLST